MERKNNLRRAAKERLGLAKLGSTLCCPQDRGMKKPARRFQTEQASFVTP